MAFKVRTIEKIIAQDLDTSDYPTKSKLIAAAREIRNQEKAFRDQEKAEEEEIKQAEREAERIFRSRSSPRSRIGMTVAARRKLQKSGVYRSCNTWFNGCAGTGYIKDKYGQRTLPHARCNGTGLRKVPKVVRRRIHRKRRHKARKVWRKQQFRWLKKTKRRQRRRRKR